MMGVDLRPVEHKFHKFHKLDGGGGGGGGGNKTFIFFEEQKNGALTIFQGENQPWMKLW